MAVAQRRENNDASAFLRLLARLLAPFRRAVLERYDSTRLGQAAREWLPEGHAQHFFLVAAPAHAQTPYFDGNGLQHRADSRGVLAGTIYILAEELEEPYRSAQQSQLAELRYKIGELNAEASAKDIAALRSQIVADAETISDHQIRVKLYRTGECRLRVCGIGLSDKKRDLLAKHGYFFARDTAHRHYHHASTDDKLLPAVAVREGHAGDDLRWRREVLWALTKAVGDYRRSRAMAQRRQALGITAYAEAFQATLARVRRVPTGMGAHVEEHSLATFDFKHLRESAKVSNEVSSWRRQGGFSVAALCLATTISIAALWVSTTRLAERTEWRGSSAFKTLIHTFFDNPGFAAVLAWATIFVVWDATYSERSVSDRLFKTFLAASWPSRSHGRRAKGRVIAVAFAVAATLALLLDFQFGIWLFRSSL